MPRLAPFDRPATYDDLVELPDHLVAEIIDGELHASPRPAPRHAMAASVLGAVLLPPFHLGRDGPGGWWILDEPELHLGNDVAVPDLAGWRRSTMHAMPETAWFAVAPEWLAEVLSPSTALLDRAKKLAVYAREGVRNVWLIDPAPRTLEVLRLENDRWTIVATYGGDQVVRAEPFSEVEVNLSTLWADT